MADILDQLAAEQDAEPTGAAPVDLFDSFSQEQDQRQAGHDERLRLMFEAGLQKSPDQRAGILEVARQSRLPADVVEQKFPEFKARAEAAAFDPARFRAENPDLYQLFLENPEAGQIVVRDAKASQLARALVAVVTGRSPLEQAAGAESEVKLRDERRAAILAQQVAQYDPAVTEEQRKALEARRADVEGRIQAELDRTRPVAGIEESKAHLSAVEKILGKASVAPKGWPAGGVPGGTEQAEQGVLGAAYGQGSLVVERGNLGREWVRRVLAGGDTWEVEKKLVDVENRMVPRFYGDGTLTAILQSTGELLPAQVESYKGAGVGGAVGALAGAAVGKAVPAIGVGKGAKAGARLGAKGGLWLSTFGLEQGNAAADYRDLKTDAGERVSPEVAVGWSVVYGVVSATIETGTELSKLGSWGPLGEMIRKGTLREEGKRLVRTPTFRRLLAQVARGYAGNIAKESGEEGLQQLAQEAIGYIARSQQAGALQSPDVVGSVEAVSESLEKAAVGSILPGAAGPIVNLTTQTIGQQRAKRGQDQIRAIVTDAKDSSLAQASPDAYARLIEIATERTGEKVTAIYVDPAAMTALFQDSDTPGVSPEAAAAATELMGAEGPRRLQEALATGQKLEVPLAEFAERWRGKPIADALLDHVSAKPFLPTASEAAAQAEQREAEAQALVDSIEKGEKAATPEEAPLDQLAADLVTAGRMKPADAETDVRLWRKALNALAVRSGVELKDLVKSFVVRVQAEGQAPAPAITAERPFWAATAEKAKATLAELRAQHGDEADSLPEFWAASNALADAAGRLEQGGARAVTSTPEFRAWFGESKVVDKKGRPLLVYHGTASDHVVFDPNHRHVSMGDADGIWFTMSRQYAWEYAQNARAHFDGEERLIGAYLKVENPLIVEFDGDPPLVGGKEMDWTSNKQVIDYARKNGHDGVIWPNGSFTDAPSITVFRADQIKSNENRGTFDPRDPNILHQPSAAGPRGWVTRVQEGLRSLFQIVLTDRANLSTFLHESGHVFMDILGELASREGASPQLVADWEAALKFMGVADRAELTERLEKVRGIRGQAAGRLEHGGAPVLTDAEAAEVKALTAPFEKWARAFERYLMEGKAPSLELAGAFQRFKLWLRTIYRQIDALGVELNDEIRGVFDRLLATDEEIARAQEEMGPTSLFRSPEEAGMQDKPEEWAAYLERAKKAISAAQQAARQRAASQRLAATEAWWKAERRARRDAALEAYDALPAVVALRFLRKGDAGDNAALQALRAARPLVGAALPPADAARLTALQAEIAKLEGTAGGPLDRPSRTRPVVVVARPGEEGGVDVALAEGPPAEGEKLWRVALPSWLTPEEFLDNRLAWEWTWAAVEGGSAGAEQAQKAVFGFMSAALESFPESEFGLKQGFAVARLAAGKGGKAVKGLRVRLAEWAEAPEATRGAVPIPERAWGALIDTTRADVTYTTSSRGFENKGKSDVMAGWLARSRAEIDTARPTYLARPPSWYSTADAVEAPKESARETKLAALRAEQAAINARAGAAAAAAGRPKLDHAAVLAILGKDVKKIPTEARGIEPDVLAELVAPGSGLTGEQLVQDIAGLPARSAWAAAQADDAMSREFPDVANERDALRDAAGRAFHGDALLTWFLHEEQILRKRLAESEGRTLQGMGAGSAGISAESVRRAAEILVDRMTLERLDLGHYQGAERQAAQKAAVAAAKGDYGQALVYLQQRLLNFFAVRYLAEARDVRDGLLEEGKKAAKDTARARVGKGSPAIRDGIDRIVEGLGLGPARQHDAPLATLSAAVDAVEASGVTVIFDPDALAAAVDRPPVVASRRNGEPGAPWRGLSVAQAKNVLAALKNMRKAATSNLTALVDGQRMDFDELVARLVDEGQDNLPDRGAPTSSTMAGTLLQVAGGIVSGIDGDLLRPETMLTWLGGKAAGIESWWYRAIVAPMQAAKVREADLLRETVAPIVDAMEAIPAEVKRRMRDAVDGAALFPGHTRRIQPISRRYELIALALNIGNEGNLERLMEGRGITLAEVKRAVGLLTREELAYVQTCWDAAEKLGALAFEMEERLSGLAPEKVQAKPITIALADGTEVSLRGGYWPAVYDQRVEVKGERQAADMTMASEFLDPRFVRPGTNHNFLKSRVQGTTGILSLDPTIVQSHLVQVAHDVAFREAVLSVGKLFLSPEIQDVLKSRLGNERAKIFLDWVKDVARSRGAAAVSQARTHTNLGTRLRSNMAVGALGYAVDVVVGDLTNPAVAAVKFKNPLHLTAAIAECVAHPLETRRWAIQKSGELRVRADELVRRWKQHRNELTKRRFPGREAFDAYVEHAFDLFEMSDALTATPIWVGAYREGLELYDNDDALAVEYADKLVRETFPTQSIVDQSAIQRDKGFWGAAMLFFGYLNTIFNLRRDIAHDAYQTFHDPEAGALDRAGAVAKAAWKWVAVVAAYQVLGEFLSGRGQEPDEKFTRWLLRKALVGLTVGDLPLGALAEPTISRIVTGKAKRVSVRAAPAVAVLQGAADSLSKALDGKGDAKEFFDVARSLGLLLGVPTRPLRAAEYVATKAGDDLQAGRLNEIPAGLIYGERKNQPANPLRPGGGK